jgi:hypothetical protein
VLSIDFRNSEPDGFVGQAGLTIEVAEACAALAFADNKLFPKDAEKQFHGG